MALLSVCREVHLVLEDLCLDVFRVVLQGVDDSNSIKLLLKVNNLRPPSELLNSIDKLHSCGCANSRCGSKGTPSDGNERTVPLEIAGA
jgi:hypothetical protein